MARNVPARAGVAENGSVLAEVILGKSLTFLRSERLRAMTIRKWRPMGQGIKSRARHAVYWQRFDIGCAAWSAVDRSFVRVVRAATVAGDKIFQKGIRFPVSMHARNMAPK